MRQNQFFAGLLTLALLGACGYCQDENKGQEDYNKAIVLKVKAKTVKEYDEVIDLCESALEKGLSEDSKKLAQEMINNTLNEICIQLSDEVLEMARTGQATWRFKRRQALVRLEKLAELDDKNGDAFYRIAQLQLLPGGDRKKAQEAINSAVAAGSLEEKDATKALMLKGMLADNDEAREQAFTDAIEKDPKNQENYKLRAGYYFDKRKFDKAEGDFRKLIELDPENEGFKRGLIDCLLNQEEDEKTKAALEVLNGIIENDKENLELYIQRARIHSRLDDVESHLKDLSLVIEKDDRNLLALVMRGWAYLGEEKTDKAKEDLERIFEINKYNLQGFLLQAAIAADEEDYDLAIKNLKNVVMAVPKQSKNFYRTQLALYYRQAEQFNNALDVYEAILKEEPANVDAIVARADTVLGMGQHEQAVADYETSMDLELSKRQKEHVWNNLAWVLATSPTDSLRDGKRAIKLASKACEITDYKEAYILSTLASGYAEIGDFDMAIKWSSEAVKLAEKNPTRDDQVDDLKKELESYKKGKPWRELQDDKDASGKERKKADDGFDF